MFSTKVGKDNNEILGLFINSVINACDGDDIQESNGEIYLHPKSGTLLDKSERCSRLSFCL